MTEFDKILDRINLDSVISCFLYGSEPVEKLTEAYEAQINDSYKTIFAELAKLLPHTPETDEALHNLIFDFATTHSDIYLHIGAIIGFQLYKVMEQEYHDIKSEKIDKFLKKIPAPKDEPEK